MVGRLGTVGSNPSTGGGRLGVLATTVDPQVAKDQKQKDLQTRLDNVDAQSKARDQNPWDPFKILGDIGNAVVGVARKVNQLPADYANSKAQEVVTKVNDNITRDEKSGKINQAQAQGARETAATGLRASQEASKGATFTELSGVPNFVRQSTASLSQAQKVKDITGTNNATQIDQQHADTYLKFIDEDLKSGKINQAQAKSKRKQVNDRLNATTTSADEVTAETGITPSKAGLEGAFFDVASNAVGLGAIPKVIFKKAAEALSTKLGRDLTNDELTSLAAKTKQTIPEASPQVTPQAETPVPISTSRVPSTQRLGTIGEQSAAPKINAVISDDLKTVPNIDTKVKTVKAGDLRMGSDTLGTEVDSKMVDKYVADMKSGKPMDPIVVTKDKDGQLFVQDGQHRLEAAKQLGITDIPTVEQLPKNTPIKESVTENLKIVEPETPARPTGDTVSGNSLRIQQKAVEEKLTNNMGDLPQYKSINMKDQAEKAVNLVQSDRQKAIDIIEGKANPPDGLHAQSIHQALELAAIKEKDGALLVKLANSHVNTELSEGAQKLRIAAERDPLSATEQIRQIQEARAKKSTLRGTTVTKEIERAIKVVSKSTRINTKQELSAFIKGLEC